MTKVKIEPENLTACDVVPSIATHEGFEATRLVLTPDAKTPDQATFALVNGVDFCDGVIEIDVAGRPLPDAIPEARGFIGIAFRVQPNNSAFECIYIRPTNGRAAQQLRRNRSTQYVSYPDWPFDRIRQEMPGHYESYVDLITGAWTSLRIVVEGETAKLFVHGNEQPSLIVNDLKHGEGTPGGIGLFIDNGTEGFFRDLRISSTD